MTKSPVKTEAFLLRSVDYRDSDRILTLLTREIGKISALARGARKNAKQYGGALIPFAHIELVLEQGRGTLSYVKEATLKEANMGLSTHLGRLGGASYIVEIIRESTPENLPDPPLFDLMSTSLPYLAGIPTEEIAKAVISIVLKIMEIEGFAVGLDRCNACEKPVPKGRPVLFHPGRGGVVCTPCGGGPIRLEAETIDGLNRLRQTPIESTHEIRLGPKSIHQAEEALATFMEHHLGRHLKTRAYFLDANPTVSHS